LRKLAAALVGADTLARRAVRDRAIALLKEKRVADPAGLVDAALKVSQVYTESPEPVKLADEEQDLGALLDELSSWIIRYVSVPAGAADALALWIASTWCVDAVLFAPLLVLMSATKRAGKTTMMGLLSCVVRQGHLTSAFGVSSAVLFRLNA